MKYAKEEIFFTWNVLERDSDNFLFVPVKREAVRESALIAQPA